MVVREGGYSEIELETISQDTHTVDIAPLWMPLVVDVENDIAVIKEKIAELYKKHQKRIQDGFDDSMMTELEQEIDIATRTISAMFQRTYAKIKKIGSVRQSSRKLSSVEKNIQSKLANELQILSSEFRKSQQDYMQRVRRLESGFTGDEELGLGGYDNDGQFLTQVHDPGFDTGQMRRLTQRESTAAQWEREMKNILTSVQEASAIFKDLSMLVIEQGAIVDRIDFNLEQAEENMDAGIENLIVVKKEAARSKTKYCMLLLCMVLVLALILLLLKVVLKVLLF